jgi:hypothetical protein
MGPCPLVGRGVLITALMIPPIRVRIDAEERLLRLQFETEYNAFRLRHHRFAGQRPAPSTRLPTKILWWCTSRSTTATVIAGSAKTLPHFPFGDLVSIRP